MWKEEKTHEGRGCRVGGATSVWELCVVWGGSCGCMVGLWLWCDGCVVEVVGIWLTSGCCGMIVLDCN